MNNTRLHTLACITFAVSTFISAPTFSAGATLPDIDYEGADDLVCDPFGDFIGCSISGLNFVQGVEDGTYNLLDPSTFETNGIYSGQFTIVSNQGFLQDQLVVATGNTGQSSVNSDYETGGIDSIDDAYSPPGGAGSLTGFSTNNTPSAAELAAGVQPQTNDPGGVSEFAGDTGDTWDISISSLLSYLTTPDGLNWDPYFVFANNQNGSGPGQDLSLWGLFSVIDTDGALAELSWEFTNADYTAMGVDTPRSQGDDPVLPGDYVEVDGDFCLNPALVEIPCEIAESTDSNGDPSDDLYLYFNNNIGNNVSEFIGFIPELTYDYLATLLAAGYETFSIDARYFDNTNGFDDIFLVLGSPDPDRPLPEPSTVALLALGLLFMWRLSLRRRQNK